MDYELPIGIYNIASDDLVKKLLAVYTAVGYDTKKLELAIEIVCMAEKETY